MRVSSHDSKDKFKKFGKAGAGPKFGISSKRKPEDPSSDLDSKVQDASVALKGPSSAKHDDHDESVQLSKAPGAKRHRNDGTAPIATELSARGDDNKPARGGDKIITKLAQGKRKNSKQLSDDAPTIKMTAFTPSDAAITASGPEGCGTTQQPIQRALPSATTLPPPLGETEQLPPSPRFVAPRVPPSTIESAAAPTVQVDAGFFKNDLENDSKNDLENDSSSVSATDAKNEESKNEENKNEASVLSTSSAELGGAPQDAAEEAAAIAAIADLDDIDDETVENSYIGQPPTAPLGSGEFAIPPPVAFTDLPSSEPRVPTMAEVARAAAWKQAHPSSRKWARKRETQNGTTKTPHPLRIALGILMIGLGIYLLAVFIPSHEPATPGVNIGSDKWLFTEGQHSAAAAFAFAFLALGALSLFRGASYRPSVQIHCNHCQMTVNAVRHGFILKCENGGHRAGIQFVAIGLLISAIGLVVGFVILTLLAG